MARLKGWDRLLTKFHTTLAKWKVKALSIGGRSVLLKSVLGGLGVYYLSLFVMPVTIAKKLESLRSTFFWGGSETEKKMAWVKWDQMLAKKESGGLEIGSLVSFNLALILKWKWRFFQSPSSIWDRLIRGLYGNCGGFYARRSTPIGTSPWSRVIAAVSKLDVTNVVYENTLMRQVGNGRDTRFWEDCWIGDRPLAKVYPRLAALEVHRNCMVADRWRVDGWMWEWQRPLVGRNLSTFENMVRLLADFRCGETRDGWMWKIGPDGGFTVGETRRWIDDMVLLVGVIKTRWCDLVPRKVNIFIWRMRLRRIPTRVAISGRGMEIDSILCPICGVAAENIDHLFGRCGVASSLWGLVFRWLQVPLRVVADPEEMFGWVDGCNMNVKQRRVIEAVICTTYWVIWMYRNDVVHNERHMRKEILFYTIRECAFLWVSNRRKKLSVCWTTWFQNPLINL